MESAPPYNFRVKGMTGAVGCLSSKYEIFSSYPSTAKILNKMK
jgi:hypothetical protein